MATTTERFGFTKPAGTESGDVSVINSNTDLTELYLGRTQDMIAPMYDDTATYDVGDIVTYESNLYKCITAITTPETFDDTKWEATTAVEEGSGGGGGSSVIPNPTGTPTDTLSTIGIDGTIYGIEGGGSISGEGVEIYSESEYIVGKWIDGKKLYQKTIDFGAMPAQGDSKSVAHNISNIDKIISWEAFGVNASGLVMFVPNISRGNVASQTSVSANATNVNIFNGSSSDLTSEYNGYVTIRYTKTVETPAPAWGGSVTNNYAGFIDTDNVIYSGVYNPTTPLSYTATEDCFVVVALIANSNPCVVSVDNKEIYRIYDNGIGSITVPVPMKKGQTITATTSYSAEDSPYTVYGITYASGGSEAPATDASEVEYDNTTSHLTADNVQEAIDEVVANAGTASEDILTLQNVQGYDEYDETQTYAVGDYAIYNNIVYECTTAVSTAEPFDSTKWTATSIEQIIDGVKGDITQLNSSKSNLLTVDTTLQTVGAVAAGSIKDFTIDVAKSGYTPLGVIGFNIGAGGGCGMISIRLGGSNIVSVRIRNNGNTTSSDNTDCRVYVLYLKND